MGLLTLSRDNVDPPLLHTADSTNAAVMFTLCYQQCQEAEELCKHWAVAPRFLCKDTRRVINTAVSTLILNMTSVQMKLVY